MTTPTDPLESLGQRSALAVADRQTVTAPDEAIGAIRRRAQRPRRRQIAAVVVLALVMGPVAVSLLRTPPRDIRFTPPPAPAPWVEVGRNVFNGEGAAGISGVAVAGETIVAVGLDPDPGSESRARPAAWRSQDGRSWDAVSVSDGGALYAGASALFKDAGLLMQDVTAVSMGEMEWLVAVGYANFEPRTEPIVWLSYDEGRTWELHRVGGTGVMTSLTATPSGLVAVGYDDDQPAAWTSLTGEEWIRQHVDDAHEGFPAALTQVTSSGDRLVAVGRDGWEENPAFWVSDGGTDWEQTGPPHLPDARLELSSVSATPDGGFLSAGTLQVSGEPWSDGSILESEDGMVWERALPPASPGTPGDQSLSAAVSFQGERLALGSDQGRATIWSATGDDWEIDFTDEAVPVGTSSHAERVFATPAGLITTGISTSDEGTQEARMWLRSDPNAPTTDPVQIIDQPIGTFGGVTPVGPIVADGISITAGGFESGVVTATDVATGAELWTYDLFENSFLGPVADSTLLVAAHYGQVVALDLASGSERWSLLIDVAESPGAPTIADGVVYLPTTYQSEGDTAAPRLHAVDLDDGTVLWRRALEEGTDLQWAPPVVTEDLVLVADTLSHPRSAPTSWLHAVERATGERVWRFDLQSRRQGFNDEPPLVGDGRVFVTGAHGPLFAVDLATGEELWQRPAQEKPRPLRLEGDRLLVELDGEARVVNVADGSLID